LSLLRTRRHIVIGVRLLGRRDLDDVKVDGTWCARPEAQAGLAHELRVFVDGALLTAEARCAASRRRAG